MCVRWRFTYHLIGTEIFVCCPEKNTEVLLEIRMMQGSGWYVQRRCSLRFRLAKGALYLIGQVHSNHNCWGLHSFETFVHEYDIDPTSLELHCYYLNECQLLKKCMWIRKGYPEISNIGE